MIVLILERVVAPIILLMFYTEDPIARVFFIIVIIGGNIIYNVAKWEPKNDKKRDP